jgi:hypothetical protein
MNTSRLDFDYPLAVEKWGWKYHHLGIPTNTVMPSEKYLPQFKFYVSGFGTSPFGVEWMRFEDDSPVSPLIQTVPHIAFEVDDLEKELRTHSLKIITEPNKTAEGITVAMIEHNGAPVELIEFRNSGPGVPEKKNKNRVWLISGLLFGLFMYFAMTIIYPLITQQEITLRALLIGIPLWLIGGLGWGYTMKIVMNKLERKNK